MTRFASFDENGFPTGFYSDSGWLQGPRLRPVFGPAPEPTAENPNPGPPVIGTEPNPDCKIPEEAVEITDEQWLDFIGHPGLRRWVDGEVVEYAPPDPPAPTPADYRLTKRQISAALIIGGVADDPDAWMRALLSNIPDATTRALAINDWNYAPYYDRTNALFSDPDLMAAAGKTAEDIDTLWLAAKDLPA